MHINNKFKLGDQVALQIDEETIGMVTSIVVVIGGAISYGVSWDILEATSHFAEELQLYVPVANDWVDE